MSGTVIPNERKEELLLLLFQDNESVSSKIHTKKDIEKKIAHPFARKNFKVYRRHISTVTVFLARVSISN